MQWHNLMAQPDGRPLHPAMLQCTGGRLSASQAQAQQAQPVAAARPGVSRQLWCGVPISTVWHDSCTCAAVPRTFQPVWAAPGCRVFVPASGFVTEHLLPVTVLTCVHMKHAHFTYHAHSCSASFIGYVNLKFSKCPGMCRSLYNSLSTTACVIQLALAVPPSGR